MSTKDECDLLDSGSLQIKEQRNRHVSSRQKGLSNRVRFDNRMTASCKGELAERRHTDGTVIGSLKPLHYDCYSHLV